jgi:tRNA(adenine34) deaminase
MNDDAFMGEAIRLADTASRLGEVPVGAVVVHDGMIIGRGYDARETREDPTAHAEVMAIRAAAQRLRSWRLTGCTLYVTLEPCTMCMGAIISARLDWIVYGATSPKSGAVESVLELARVPGLNHAVRVRSGVRAQECAARLASFFEALRQKKQARRRQKDSGPT